MKYPQFKINMRAMEFGSVEEGIEDISGFHANIVDHIENNNTSWEKDTMGKLVKENQLTALKHTGFYQPMDTLKEKNMLIQEQKIKMDEMEDVLEHFKKVTVNRRAKYLKTSNLKDTYID